MSLKNKLSNLILKTADLVPISLNAGFLLIDLIIKELAILNSKNNMNKEKTAILTGYDNLYDKFRFKYAQGVGSIAYHFSKKGKIEIIDKAKEEDLERVLKDSIYRNIIIYGHGAANHWWDSDGKTVYYKELNGSPKERVLQFTCGSKNIEESLVEKYAKNKKESFCPTKERTIFDNYLYGLNLLLFDKYQNENTK